MSGQEQNPKDPKKSLPKDAPGKDAPESEESSREMGLLDHLDELRKRLLRCAEIGRAHV